MQGRSGLNDWRGSGQRIAVCVVVAGIHLGLVMLLLRAPASSRAQPVDVTPARDMLRIRFLAHPLPSTAAMPPPIVLPRLPQRVPHKTTVVRVTPKLAAAPTTAYSAAPVEPQNEAPGQAAPYIAGGGFLDRAGRTTPSNNIHLPGSSQPIVRGLHMVDPRYQGIAGAVRIAQSILGAVNPHCVDVDVWRGMSVKEQLDRHMSPDQVEKTAEKFHCGPPP